MDASAGPWEAIQCCLSPVSESETKLSVRRLAAALPLRQSCLFGGEVHRGTGQHFVYVAAHDAATVRAVPIALDDHRATTLRA